VEPTIVDKTAFLESLEFVEVGFDIVVSVPGIPFFGVGSGQLLQVLDEPPYREVAEFGINFAAQRISGAESVLRERQPPTGGRG
jgi:hypothetical protein